MDLGGRIKAITRRRSRIIRDSARDLKGKGPRTDLGRREGGNRGQEIIKKKRSTRGWRRDTRNWDLGQALGLWLYTLMQ